MAATGSTIPPAAVTTAASSTASQLLAQSSDDELPDAKRAKSALPQDEVRGIIQRAIGAQKIPPETAKHIAEEVAKLAAKTTRSLALLDRKEKVLSQVRDLSAGTVPPGVKPFKLAVDVPQLDEPISGEFACIRLDTIEGTSWRQLREKLHFFYVATTKRIDAAVMQLQIESLRNEIAKTTFVKAVTTKVVEKASNVDTMMARLNLSSFGTPEGEVALSTEKANELYSEVMNKLAAAQQKEAQRIEEKKKSLAKAVESLKEAKPHDLLKATIQEAVSTTLADKGVGKSKGKGKSKSQKFANPGSKVDLGYAYSLSVTDNADLMEQAVTEHSSTAKPQKKGFQQPKSKVKPKEKADKDKEWKAKSKGKGKGKGKSKDPKSKGSKKGQDPPTGKGRGKRGFSAGKGRGVR